MRHVIQPAMLPALAMLSIQHGRVMESPTMVAGEGRQFSRGSDLLQMGEKVSAKDVANVLGRWKSHSEWDTIGVAAKLDEYTSGDYYDDDVDELAATDFSKGEEYYQARRPQRRKFCKQYGLVQRWVHADNVGALPFTDTALAASVGATVEELQQTPINPRAADVVFDALCTSKAGFVDAERCDAQRASFISSDGAFDADSFEGSLRAARVTIAGALTIYPGFLILVALVAAVQLDAYSLALDAASHTADVVSANTQRYGLFPSLIPLPILFLVGRGVTRRAAGKAGGVAEQNLRDGDRVFKEVMRIKKQTGKSDTEAWEVFKEQAKEARKLRKEGPKLRLPWAG
jgi:hypothetical protein